MGRAGLAALLLAVWVGDADAGGTRKIDIDSDPAGAAVYLNSLDEGTACQATPCTIDAPIGKTPVILRKDGFVEEITQLDVPKKGKVKPLKVTLTTAVGTLVVEDPALKGGTIKVDDVDKGQAPKQVEVDAISHHVVVELKGKALYDEFVEVKLGDEIEVKAKPVVVADNGGEITDDTTDENGEIKVKAGVASKPRNAFITGGVAFDVGFRQFAYDQPKNGLAESENEVGQAMLGPAVELWPGELLGVPALRGLSLFAKVEFGLNHQAVVDKMNVPVGPTTYWGNIEADVRHRWRLGEVGAIEISGGFVRDQLEYAAPSQAALAKVPSADYKSVRLGVRGGALLGGKVEAFGGVEGRIVVAKGELATRFDKADCTGGGVIVGASTTIGPIFAKLQGSLIYYGWELSNNDPMKPTADGASDVVESITTIIGVAY